MSAKNGPQACFDDEEWTLIAVEMSSELKCIDWCTHGRKLTDRAFERPQVGKPNMHSLMSNKDTKLVVDEGVATGTFVVVLTFCAVKVRHIRHEFSCRSHPE